MIQQMGRLPGYGSPGPNTVCKSAENLQGPVFNLSPAPRLVPSAAGPCASHSPTSVPLCSPPVPAWPADTAPRAPPAGRRAELRPSRAARHRLRNAAMAAQQPTAISNSVITGFFSNLNRNGRVTKNYTFIYVQ